MNNAINWFEIPASDFNRALNFYKEILQADIQEMEMHNIRMGLLPNDGTNVSGAIVFGEDCNPGMNGVLIYLNGGNDLQDVVNRLETIHAKILVPKTQISEDMGYFAIFIDSEGNKIGLHSMN